MPLPKEITEAINHFASLNGLSVAIIDGRNECPYCCQCDLKCDAMIDDGHICTAIYRKEVCPMCNPHPDNPADNNLF